MADEHEGAARPAEASALADLASCDGLAQTTAWAARWSARLAAADAALVWTADPVHPLFTCTGAEGGIAKKLLRRSVPRGSGIVHDLLRDRQAIVLERSDLEGAGDPWLKDLPPATQKVIAVLLEAEGAAAGLLQIVFTKPRDTSSTLPRLHDFLRIAAPAIARALRAERKTVGMLHAIERLTNLYDLSKAFGSTIDSEELNALIARKAVDFGVAEIASLWMLEDEDVTLAASAVNENYEVEHAPDSVGASLVGDLLAERESVRRNAILGDDPAAQENPGYPIHSLLALPLIEDENLVGALVLANKRGRVPEFTPEDEELLSDLSRQAVRALRNARQHAAERKVAELDALLAVSREITATLDLDRVMQTIVNASAALISYDRCAIAILDRGKLKLGAVSGMAELDRKKPEVRRSEELLSWVFLSGSDVNVTLQEDGQLIADRPETEEKFRNFFQETGLQAFYGALLVDEEGKLGVLGFECREPIVFDDETKDLLAILVNQATVAVRNAQLYRQVPLAGFFKPLLAKRRRLSGIPKRRRLAWGVGAAVAAIVLFLVPWRLRVAGPARVLPGRRAVVTAGVDGIVKAVLHREGDMVGRDEVIAKLGDESYVAALADARATYQIAQSEAARAREAGDPAALFEAQSHRDELAARIAMEEQHLGQTSLRAPAAGIIVTPRLEERVGQSLARGAELCVVADVGTVTAEVAVVEQDASLIHAGQPVELKLNPYPTRTFRGAVDRVGARIREEGGERFVIAEVGLTNTDGSLKTGMVGRGKIRAGSRRIVTLLLRRPARWLYSKLWPLLP